MPQSPILVSFLTYHCPRLKGSPRPTSRPILPSRRPALTSHAICGLLQDSTPRLTHSTYELKRKLRHADAMIPVLRQMCAGSGPSRFSDTRIIAHPRRVFVDPSTILPGTVAIDSLPCPNFGREMSIPCQQALLMARKGFLGGNPLHCLRLCPSAQAGIVLRV